MTKPLPGTKLIRSSTHEEGGVQNRWENASTLWAKAIADESPINPVRIGTQPTDGSNPIPELRESVFDTTLVETILTAADSIVSVLDSGLPQSLEMKVGEWYDLHGLATVEVEDKEVIIARQAVFSLFLKATLYEWYHRRGDLPALPPDIRSALRRAENQTTNLAFEECVLDDIVWLADESALEAVIEARDQLLQSAQPAEDIAHLYETLLPKECRHRLGQFRTRPDIADLVQGWATSGEDFILDPGMGSGSLSTPFNPQWTLGTDPAHVNGIERSPLALLMGETALTLFRQSHRPHQDDFLNLTPENLQDDVDAIVCNPPYTRHHQLPSDYKKSINRQTEQTTDLEISMLSPLYAYFFYHSRQFLSPGDRAAFIVPQDFLAASYGKALKRFLLEEYTIRALVQFNPETCSVFEDADTTTLLVFLEAAGEDNDPSPTRFIRVDEIPGTKELRNVIRDGQHGNTEWGFINKLDQSELQPTQNWQALFDPSDIDTSHLPPLSEFASVSRGPTTGKNKFFCLTQAEVEDWGIEEQYLSRLVPKPANVPDYDFQEGDWERARKAGKAVWLLDIDELEDVPDSVYGATAEDLHESGFLIDTESNPREEARDLRAYLRAGITEYELTKNKTLKSRSRWYSVRDREPTEVLVNFWNRDRFRFILNETDIRNISNYYGFYDISLSKTKLKALLAYLNSGVIEQVVRKHHRTYDGGLQKMEPGNVEELPVIDPHELPNDTVAALAECFDDLCEADRHGDECDIVVERIDAILKEIL